MPIIQTTKPPAQLLPEAGTHAEFKAAVIEQLAVYGIWDTIDKCWLGNEEGPLTYTDEMLARAAMTIINVQFGNSIRYRKKLMWDDTFNLKDVVTARLTAEEAMQQNDM